MPSQLIHHFDMSAQEAFTIFDIPEVIDQLGRYLDQHTLTSCLRVNKTWYHDFLPHLWRDIRVYDFDYNHVEHCRPGGYLGGNGDQSPQWEEVEYFDGLLNEDNNFEWPKRLCCIQDWKEPAEGHHHAGRFSHRIRSIQAGSLRVLDALGPGCINLEYVKYDTQLESYDIDIGSNSGIQFWKGQRPAEIEPRTNYIWLEILKRNPKIKYLEMCVGDFYAGEKQLERDMVEALGDLKGLEELHLCGEFTAPGWQSIVERRRGRPLKKVTGHYFGDCPKCLKY